MRDAATHVDKHTRRLSRLSRYPGAMSSPSHVSQLSRLCLVASATALALGGCASLDLGSLRGGSSAQDGATPGYVVPSGMTMPTPLPTAQPTTLPKVNVAMPSVSGYESVPRPTDSPTDATTARPDAEVTSRTWASADPLCTVQVDVTRSPKLLLAGGDDRHLSTSWASGLGQKYKRFQEERTEFHVVANSESPFTGVTTDFTATVLSTDVIGRSFVRVFSATGTLVSVTETCSGTQLDEDAWTQVLGGLSISPANDDNWPKDGATGATPSATPVKSS